MGIVRLPSISQYWDMTLRRAGTRARGAALPADVAAARVFRRGVAVVVCAGLSADKKYIPQYMSRDRWLQIKRSFRFVHAGAAAEEEPEKRKYPDTTCPNPMWKIAPLLTRFVSNSQKYWRLSQNVCVDEAMMAAKGATVRHAFGGGVALHRANCCCIASQVPTACSSSSATSPTALGSKAMLQRAASLGTLPWSARSLSTAV
jgi:hypothetical protein